MGFHCFPTLQLVYTVASISACLLMAVAVLKIPKEQWQRTQAVIMFGTFFAYIVPAAHWMVLSEQGRKAAGPKFILQFFVTLVAIVFFTKYIPERFAPGRFDIIGNSHQFWHVAIYVSIALYGEVLLQVSSLIDEGQFCIQHGERS